MDSLPKEGSKWTIGPYCNRMRVEVVQSGHEKIVIHHRRDRFDLSLSLGQWEAFSPVEVERS